MEGDRDMSLINQKSYTEVPDDWREVIASSRIKPRPFKVINCATDVSFQTGTEFLTNLYSKKCPMPTRPIRIIRIDKKEPMFISYKLNYFGQYIKAVVKPPNNKKQKKRCETDCPQELNKLYNGPLMIKQSKLKDLLHLSQFLTKPQSQLFYKNLISDPQTADDNDVEYLDDPPLDE